ncbi:ABC transporter ATP-binding protein [Actinophytocola sp. NPDC049390]|uniref:ABC transporter ATP-binding protein n=1 Tax=Actinophytocola sp. NPDC049390 TaxID=3363894 RepID=UPI00379FD0E1
MRAIEVNGLRHAYGDVVAVDGIDFHVAEGEVFALLGTNGAGKTTTLEIIEGFLRPGAGAVRVLGHDPYTERNAIAPSIGVLPQESGLIDELTVAETVSLWQRLSSRTDSPAGLVDRLALAHRVDVPVDRLSGGERRRLDVALAVWGGPRLLVLDEPTTGLDPESRQRVWALVEDLAATGTTVLLTTHYLEEAEALADRVAIMHAGRIRVDGTMSEVLASQPARITATLPSAVPRLPAFSGTAAVADGELTVETETLQQDLLALLLWADRNAVRLDDLHATQASLQEVFLALEAS